MCISRLQNDMCPGPDAVGHAGDSREFDFSFPVGSCIFDGSLLHTWLGVFVGIHLSASSTSLSRSSVVQTHGSLQVVLFLVRAKTVVGTLHYGITCSL